MYMQHILQRQPELRRWPREEQCRLAQTADAVNTSKTGKKRFRRNICRETMGSASILATASTANTTSVRYASSGLYECQANRFCVPLCKFAALWRFSSADTARTLRMDKTRLQVETVQRGCCAVLQQKTKGKMRIEYRQFSARYSCDRATQ